MTSKASSIIRALRDSFFPAKLSLERFGARYGVNRSRVHAWEQGAKPRPSTQERLYRDKVCEPTDWILPAEYPVRCKVCERPFADPAVTDCIDSECPRRHFITSPPDPGAHTPAGANGGGADPSLPERVGAAVSSPPD